MAYPLKLPKGAKSFIFNEDLLKDSWASLSGPKTFRNYYSLARFSTYLVTFGIYYLTEASAKNLK